MKRANIVACFLILFVPRLTLSGQTGASTTRMSDAPTGVVIQKFARGDAIVIDTTGAGFHFSDPATSCVLFDLKGNGKPECFSWPVAGSGNAWLVYDTGTGVVTNGTQLFTKFRPQPGHKSKNPSGYLALAEFDTNRDLVIDNKDEVWTHLRLWIDTHCAAQPGTTCVSLPSELYTLESRGIRSLGLVYGIGDKADEYGNHFRYYAPVNIDTAKDDRQHSTDAMERLTYDVFLATGPGGSGSTSKNSSVEP